jgi:glycosyltransferase involved in cell wall biosynthesis
MIYAPRLEPFGYAPLEANACGTPVIATAEGGTRETIQDGVNGLVVEHRPEHMAAAIERLIRDDELHHRLSVQAEKAAKEKWSLASSIDRLEQRLAAQIRGTSHRSSTGDPTSSISSHIRRPPLSM